MHAALQGIALPDTVVRRHAEFAHAVLGHHIKVPHRAVILGRIARGHNDPALRHAVGAEGLVLQKL